MFGKRTRSIEDTTRATQEAHQATVTFAASYLNTSSSYHRLPLHASIASPYTGCQASKMWKELELVEIYSPSAAFQSRIPAPRCHDSYFPPKAHIIENNKLLWHDAQCRTILKQKQ
jgi:hypothetical protein